MPRMNVYECTVPMFVQHLRNVERWLDKAVAYAQQKKFDPEVFLQMRLAPDQFPFVRQVQAACDSAKWACSKLAGKQAPSHPDTEATIPELRARLKAVIDYLQTLDAKDFADAESRLCQHTWMQGKSLRGAAYLKEFGWPNFFFHTTSAYQILRHNGVDLGKMDYLGRLSLE
jgi:hypothetical protein